MKTTIPTIRTAADRLRGPATISTRGLWWPGPTIRRRRCVGLDGPVEAVVRCAYCGKVQTLAGRWVDPAGVDLTHHTDTICPECMDRVVAELYEERAG
jgi:hypothetical protein